MRPRIGVSACLTGRPVRFDGGHRQDDFVESLRAVAELMPVCPEVELGMGTPRESLRLVRLGREQPSLVAPRSQRDWTGAMREYALGKIAEMQTWQLDGFILKKGSPSCGYERVRVYEDNGLPGAPARGLFADVLTRAMPSLPVEDEGRLHDSRLRESFLLRVTVHGRARRLFESDWRYRELVALHSDLKMLLLAYSPSGYRALGRLVATGRALHREQVARHYLDGVMTAMARPPTRGRHVNTLQHLAGHFKNRLDELGRRELEELIARYSNGQESLGAPVALLRHHARRLGADYVTQQLYLQPLSISVGGAP